MKLNQKYILQKQYSRWVHSWSVVGRDGAIELNVSTNDDGGFEHGGIEIHSRKPLDDCAPHHANCPLLNSNCWHDGSSLWVEKNIRPSWRFPESIIDHKIMWGHCESWYKNRFNRREEEE